MRAGENFVLDLPLKVINMHSHCLIYVCVRDSRSEKHTLHLGRKWGGLSGSFDPEGVHSPVSNCSPVKLHLLHRQTLPLLFQKKEVVSCDLHPGGLIDLLDT